MNTENNNAHVAGCGTIVGLVFCAIVGGFFYFAPMHDVPTTTTTVQPAARVAQPAARVAQPAPGKCLPSGNGGPCLSFDKIQEMMNAQPDAPESIPANPAAANEEKI